MKRTFPANINGKVYNIDEDAYGLLQKYFTQLRESFPGSEGVEISADIEARVGEIFDEKMADGPKVVTIYDVNEVIERMGRPEQIIDDEGRPAEAEDTESKPFISFNTPNKRLYRDTRHAVLGGVISGLAEYQGWNCNIMRLLIVVIALFSYLVPVCVIYLIAWMVIPPASTSRRILEMQGRPVTVDGVGRTVLDDSTVTPPPYNNPASDDGSDSFGVLLGKGMRLLGKVMLGCLFGIGALGFLGAAVFLVVVVAVMVLGLGYDSLGLLYEIVGTTAMPKAAYMLVFMLFLALSIVVPCIGIVCGTGASLFRWRCNSVGLIIALVVLEVLFIGGSIVMFNMANRCAIACATASTMLLPGMA